MGKRIKICGVIVGYALVSVLVMYLVANSGQYPAGSDTMFYLYRGDLMYHTIREQGNWYPLLDPAWYNGVQTLRYWSPLSAYILAACQALAGGSSFDGYILFTGFLCFSCCISWLYIGCKHNRPWLGSFIGLLWFFVPNNLFMLFGEGVLARSISMVVMPIFMVAVYDYLHDGKVARIITIIISFVFIIMCHVGWAGMVMITMLIFALFYLILNRKELKGTHRILKVFVAMVLAFLITGLWTIGSLRGGITTLDSSQIMINFFQSLNKSLNPFYGIADGYWNRWDDPAVNLAPYFGCIAFCLGIFGVFFANRNEQPGFFTAITVCLLTTTVAYPVLVNLPGSQYLWMLRFISIALCFLMVGFFFWNTLKKSFIIIIAVALIFESVASLSLITGDMTGKTPEEKYDKIAETTLIKEGKAITTQRMSAVEPFGSIADGIYVIAGYGDDKVDTSYGQGVQAASTYRNIVQINTAAEIQSFPYLFDRCLELGNDTVLMPLGNYPEGSVDVSEMDAAAKRSGYDLVEGNDQYRLYHIDTPENFGVISKYRAIGIGTSAPLIALDFPAVEETVSTNLNDYTFDELSKYDVIYLAGFTYDDREAAEQMLIDLSESGVKIVIMADGVPSDEHTGTQSFLGVGCYDINFENGYPELNTVDGLLNCDLFPDGYTEWKTVYVSGLDEVWGTIDELGKPLEFYGTVHNDNIIFIGLNLTFHYSLTKDAAVGRLLSRTIDIDNDELPEREIVPLDIKYNNKSIEIDSDYDNVNTTLAYHDIFTSQQDIEMKNHLTYVDKGHTVIDLHYPYFWQGLAVTLLGLVLSVIFIGSIRRRQVKESREKWLDSINKTLYGPDYKWWRR